MVALDDIYLLYYLVSSRCLYFKDSVRSPRIPLLFWVRLATWENLKEVVTQ